jgi:hypothetical protein
MALGMLACNFGAAAPSAPVAPGGANQGETQGAQSAPAVNPPSGDPKQAIIDAYTKLDSAYPYRLTETDTGSLCAKETRTTEFAAKDEWHSTWSGCLSGEAISTGGKTYYKINGTWQGDGGAAPPGAEQQANIAEMVKAALENVQAAGNESLNGANMYVYTFDLNDPVLKVKGGKTWIGAADGLPHQAQISIPVANSTEDVLIAYEFGVTVNIKPPTP